MNKCMPIPRPIPTPIPLASGGRRSCFAGSRLAAGFTLIELMITVAIVGILASIALPSYRGYIVKTRRAEAMSELTKAQTVIERCYGANFTYVGACSPATPTTTPNGFYIITAASAATTYTFTATAAGTQASDTTCATMTIDQANQKLACDASAAAQTVCWNP